MTSAFTEADYRPLGTTDIRVSPLGLGTVKLGRNSDVKYPAAFELPTDAEASALLDKARELGINLLDTAPAYGSAESRLGRLIDRTDWVLSTKVGEYYEDGESSFDFSRSATEASIDASLRRLGTDFLDIVLVHSDGNDEAIIGQTDVMETLQRLQVAGKIRAIGVSTKSVAGGLLAVEVADLVMLAFSPEDVSQKEVLARADQLGKGVLIKKGLSSGHTKNPAESLRFVLSAAGVTSAIVGTINPVHLEENVRVAKAP